MTKEEADKIENDAKEIYEAAFQKARSGEVYVPDSEHKRKAASEWAGFKHMSQHSGIRNTGITSDSFQRLGKVDPRP